ncbi:biliverdin-producing heme oxygenase [Pyxidicoccus caerfyrddinensis]|uniref:biliverdin-producing heme oxygenase n=1 Tax=Pyxidicoccus caerfyrddinensis TaxID=2709663 RepID=UPI0013DBD667|nr:biliverdin-producing heme oxygenase [Pyxidicoccus caerfyrddinensis]
MNTKEEITIGFTLQHTVSTDTGDGFIRGVERWLNPSTFEWLEFDLSKRRRFRRIIADATTLGPWERLVSLEQE